MRSMVCYGLMLLFTQATHSQIFNLQGNVSADATPVRYASVTFIDQTDTTQRISTITDSLGNYRLSVTTAIDYHDFILPSTVELAQNYPNPFLGTTLITYQLNKPADVSIRIYNLLGQEVKELNVAPHLTGTYGVIWDGKDNYGKRVAPGVYFCQLQVGNETRAKKMLYGLGGTSVIPVSVVTGAIPETVTLQKIGMVKEQKESNEVWIFTVCIENTDSTRPIIVPVLLLGVKVQQDTILDFRVQEAISNYSVCYVRLDSMLQPDGKYYLNWEIYLNNTTGKNPKNITNWIYSDEQPAWSPDGKYIAFLREDPEWDGDLYLYDTEYDTCIGLLTSDTFDATGPVWTPDSKKIAYHYHVIGQPWFGYIVDVDGSNNRKLDYAGPEFFYPDSYTYIYAISGYNIYRSNIDGTFNELLLDLKTIGKNYVHMEDFNPQTNEILILADPTECIKNLLVTYNIDNKKIDTLSIADPGWIYARPKFSNDFTKIAIGEVQYSSEGGDSISTYRISVLESGRKIIVVEFREKGVFLGFHPFAFSPDGKYLAFAKNIIQPGAMFWWISYLYVVELETKQIMYIDTGENPQWNTAKPH